MELQGSIAVVTGVSQGIGKATARAMLDQGIRVVGWGRTAPDIKDDAFFFVRADVRDEEEVRAAADKTEEEVGKADILVNNAGLGINGPIEEMSSQQ